MVYGATFAQYFIRYKMSLSHIFVSQRRPEYENHTDFDIESQLKLAEKNRSDMLDDGADDALIDDIDRLIFKLDDELCARGL